MGSVKRAWALLPWVALLASGCERRGEEVRPEPISLSRETPRRPGVEHGQDSRRASDHLAAPSKAEGPDAADVYEEAEPSEDESDDGEVDEGKTRRSAKHRSERRKRTGGVAEEGQGDKRATSTSLHAKRLIVARKIDGREPMGVSRSFDGSEVGEVAAFVELSNDDREETKIVMRFEPPSGASFEVPLEVGAAPRWRTWATTKRPLVAGTWKVRVLDEEGALVAQTTFEVTE